MLPGPQRERSWIPPLPLQPRPASSRFRYSDGARSDERVAGLGTKKSGGSGPRDLLEDLKALLFRKAEEWWQEMTLSDVIPPVTYAAAVSRTVRARSRLTRNSSRSRARKLRDRRRRRCCRRRRCRRPCGAWGSRHPGRRPVTAARVESENFRQGGCLASGALPRRERIRGRSGRRRRSGS
jgi:hypothetical protein